ncbi:MAG TPA: putative glycoside hydrolase [Bryobacterales bacterium]|nr:putative glycoside hydrolase [Bryobacterales bacterium]
MIQNGHFSRRHVLTAFLICGAILFAWSQKPPGRTSPGAFQGVYLTSWSAGSPARIRRVIELAQAGRINTVVIDIKDATGYVAYATTAPDAARYGARRVTIRDVDSLLGRLHREGLYVIARIVVFQDPRLALARPELAVHQHLEAPPAESDGAGAALRPAAVLWLDRKHLAWIDPASREAWSYNAALAKEALSRGFDEINFDYVRFPSDGDLKQMEFPVWDGATPKREVIRRFFAYVRREMPDAVLSADLFGLSTVNHDDLGIGQVIEDAYPFFDYVCPMVYPSHFAAGFLGFPNPAEQPYRVVNYSLGSAGKRLRNARPVRGRLRPWLQDFNIGARYDKDRVEAQIKAVQDALGDAYAGYLLWSPSNNYTEEALAVIPRSSSPIPGPAAAPDYAAPSSRSRSR